jgi:hypothetical protein
MAGEDDFGSLANQRTPEDLHNDALLLAADRSNLQNHPALIYVGDFAGSGTLQRKVSHVGLFGFDLPAVVAEGATIPNTQMTDGATVISVQRRGLSRAPTDEARFTDSLGFQQPRTIADDAFASHNLALTRSIAELQGGWVNGVTTSGVDLTTATVLAAYTLLEVSSLLTIGPGDAMGILHPVQWGDFRDDLTLAIGGSLQYNVTPELRRLRGVGFISQFLGVDWFSSSYIPTANAGADRAGGIFVRSGIIWADMSPQTDGPDQMILGKTLVERDRQAPAGISAYPSASWHGVSRALDTHGKRIVTDA